MILEILITSGEERREKTTKDEIHCQGCSNIFLLNWAQKLVSPTVAKNRWYRFDRLGHDGKADRWNRELGCSANQKWVAKRFLNVTKVGTSRDNKNCMNMKVERASEEVRGGEGSEESVGKIIKSSGVVNWSCNLLLVALVPVDPALPLRMLPRY